MILTQKRISGNGKQDFRRYAVLVSSAVALSGFGCAELAKILPFMGGTYSPSTTNISSSSTNVTVSSNNGPVIITNGNGKTTVALTTIGTINYNMIPLPPVSSLPSPKGEDAGVARKPVQAQGSSSKSAPAADCNMEEGPVLPCDSGTGGEIAEGEIFSIEKLHFTFRIQSGMVIIGLISSDCKEKNRMVIPFNQSAAVTLKDDTKYIIAPQMTSCDESGCSVHFKIIHLCHRPE